MEDETEKKKLVADVLMKMYLEQSNLARHQETQRSTVTTIFTSLAVALLGLIGALWKIGNGGLDRSFLPITIGLMLLGLIGLVLTTKLFERSMVHFTLSEAYLNTINALVAEDMTNLFPKEKVKEILYVQNAKKNYVEKEAEAKPFEVSFPNGKKEIKRLDSTEMKKRIEQHNPIDPREITMPIHNEVARFLKIPFSRVDLWTLWAIIYGLFVAAGAFLTYLSW
jgi:hypothetical protein